MSESNRVVVVGSYNHDHIWRVDRFPQAGETRLGCGFQVGAGGKGFNQAVACQRQGGNAVFIGAIGDDTLGASARRIAEDEKLACRWQVLADQPTAATSVIVDAQGRNQIVVNAAANEHLASDFIKAQRDAFASAGIVLVQMETTLDAVRSALQLAGEAGLTRILNPAPVHADTDVALLRQCDLLTPNETEFALLLERLDGTSVDPDTLANQGDAALHALCRRLPVPTVIVTLGSHGCFVSHADDAQKFGDAETHYRIRAERVDAIDTTGAGDCFNGALAAAMVRDAGQALRNMLVHANRAAALSTEREGAAASMPGLDAVQQRFGNTEPLA